MGLRSYNKFAHLYVGALLVLAGLGGCGQEPAAPRRTSPMPNQTSSAPVAPPDRDHAFSVLRQAFVARTMAPDAPPEDVRVFEGAGPVGFYAVYAGASADTLLVELRRGGAALDRCEPAVLEGDSGYFCRFENVDVGDDYEITAQINGFIVAVLPFTVAEAGALAGEVEARDTIAGAPNHAQLSRVPWERRPTARELERVYPRAALRRGVSGSVKLGCVILARGEVECQIVEESPVNLGFGAAALRLSRSFRMRARQENGASTEGARVEIPVQFEAP